MNRQAKTDISVNQHHRIKWIDIAKAYGIIAIVLGHIVSGTQISHFLYWWHIPLFFIISGIFLKPLANRHEWRYFFNHRIKNELLLYVVMGGLLIFAYTLLHHRSTAFLTSHLLDLIWGGRTLNFYTSTFWFINAYIITIFVMTLILSLAHHTIIPVILVTSSMILGTSYKQVTWMHINGFAMMPWSLDTVLITTFYAYVGYLLFHTNHEWIQNPWAISGIIVLTMVLILIHLTGDFSFRLSLKSHLIQSSMPSTIAMMIIPVIFSLGVMVSAFATSKLPFTFGLPIIGRHTLAIMYGHKLFLDVCQLMGINNLLLKLAIGIGAPLLIALALKPAVKIFKHPSN